MKITLYTVSDCQFSKAEKEFLAAHQLPFEEKNLEANREYLTEMLTLSNNFAGTPVTKVEQDTGKIEVLKGFTQAEFETALGLAKSAPQPAFAQATIPDDLHEMNAGIAVPPPAVASAAPAVNPSPTPTPPQPEPSQPNPPPTVPEPTAPPAPQVPQTEDPQMKSLLNDLQQKSESTAPVTPASMPNVPDFTAK